MSRRLQIPGEREEAALLAACESALERARAASGGEPWPEPDSYLAAALAVMELPVDAASLDGLWALQNDDGGFPAYPGGPSRVDASATVWLAMKVADCRGERVARLTRAVKALGGGESFALETRTEWALAGLIPADRVERDAGAAAAVLHQMPRSCAAVLELDLGEIGGTGKAVQSGSGGLKQWWARSFGAGARERALSRNLDALQQQAQTGVILDPAARAASRALTRVGRPVIVPATILGPEDYRSFEDGVSSTLKAQEPDGSWRDREGSIHGTWQALRSLREAGYDDHEAEVLRAGEWLRFCQNADGGWGEMPGSTVSSTAWALMGLMDGGDPASESATEGVEYLLAAQSPGGQWRERAWTRTVSPGLAYARDEARAHAHAVLAIEEFLRVTQATRGANG
jgi:squalene-hopene/tetraprenyl-beta-curcumene cyclase